MNQYLYETSFLYPKFGLYKLHQEIWSRILNRSPEEKRDFLYTFSRPDFYSGLMVTVRSQHIPEKIPKQRLEIPIKDQSIPYSLRANPTTQDDHGKHRAIMGHSQLINWLEHQGQRHGFTTHNTKATQCCTTIKRTGRRPIILNDAIFIGTLQIIQPTLFYLAMEKGIGRARGFGYGMLMLTHRNLS
jgi:CRISPR-associated protein Cas6/Cse3/CasE subtype I-E